jgi:2,3-bisphosphoglycerate-dependent phosphoglycerate mutase
MITSLYMVRHAESPFVFGQERTRGLSEQGREAARKAAEIMRPEKVDAVVSSPYTRAVETVRGIAEDRGLEITLYEELRERPIKGLDYRMSEEELIDGIRRAFADRDFALPGGESNRQAQERAIPVIRKLLEEYRGRKVAIGTHGNIMTIMINYYDERYGFDFWKCTSMPDIYRLDFEGERLMGVERMWGA